MKRFRIILSILCLLLIGDGACKTMPACYAKEQNKMDLYAKAAVLMDGNSGRILYGRDENEELPMASTTKIMTCIIALEQGDLNAKVTASSQAVNQPRVRLGMKIGKKYRMKDLLYAMMLESYNDTAVAVAEGVSGSQKAFVAQMNKKAKELGCTHTYFVTPNGIDGIGKEGIHRTTAKELAIIMTYCIMRSPKKEQFLKLTQTRSYSVEGHLCKNHNQLLNMNVNAISGKTGFTGKAGYCYVGAARKEERTYILSLLACGWPNNKSYKWSDAKKLLEYGTKYYHYESFAHLLSKGEMLPRFQVTDSRAITPLSGKTYLDLKQEAGWPAGMLLKEGEKPSVCYRIRKKVTAPVYKDSVVGFAECTLDGKVYKRFLLRSRRGYLKRSFGWAIKYVISTYF